MRMMGRKVLTWLFWMNLWILYLILRLDFLFVWTLRLTFLSLALLLLNLKLTNITFLALIFGNPFNIFFYHILFLFSVHKSLFLFFLSQLHDSALYNIFQSNGLIFGKIEFSDKLLKLILILIEGQLHENGFGPTCEFNWKKKLLLIFVVLMIIWDLFLWVFHYNLSE